MKNLFLFLLVLSPLAGFGQDDDDYSFFLFLGNPTKDRIVKIIHSDKLVQKGNDISIMTGGILMQVDETTTKIKCDSAIIDYEKYVLLAYGNVVLSSDIEPSVKYSSIKLDLNIAKGLVLGKDRIGSK